MISDTALHKPPHVAVVIVNYNAGEWLARSVQSVLEQTHTNFTCVIVDNGSVDGSLSDLPKLDKRFIILELNENTGFAHASNIGAKRADEEAPVEWVAMLNPDAFAKPDWLETLLVTTQYAPNVTMVGSTQILALEPGKFDGIGDYFHFSGLAWRAGFEHEFRVLNTKEAFGPCGAGALYHYKTFETLGGYDADFFCYFEDVDLAYRMRLYGGTCIQSSRAIIHHVSSAISGKASNFAVYHGTRNRIWTFYKNTPFPLIILLMPVHIAMNIAMLFWSTVRGRRFAPTWRGMRDGFRRLPEFKDKRRKIMQNYNVLGNWDLLKSFSWSPVTVIRRKRPKVQIYPEPDKSA